MRSWYKDYHRESLELHWAQATIKRAHPPPPSNSHFIAYDIKDRDSGVQADPRCIYTIFRMTKASDLRFHYRNHGIHSGDYLRFSHRAAAQALFAAMNSPCRCEHIPSDAWSFTDASHYIPETDLPSLQRCVQNSDLLAFVEQTNPNVGLSSWMAMRGERGRHLVQPHAPLQSLD